MQQPQAILYLLGRLATAPKTVQPNFSLPVAPASSSVPANDAFANFVQKFPAPVPTSVTSSSTSLIERRQVQHALQLARDARVVVTVEPSSNALGASSRQTFTATQLCRELCSVVRGDPTTLFRLNCPFPGAAPQPTRIALPTPNGCQSQQCPIVFCIASEVSFSDHHTESCAFQCLALASLVLHLRSFVQLCTQQHSHLSLIQHSLLHTADLQLQHFRHCLIQFESSVPVDSIGSTDDTPWLHRLLLFLTDQHPPLSALYSALHSTALQLDQLQELQPLLQTLETAAVQTLSHPWPRVTQSIAAFLIQQDLLLLQSLHSLWLRSSQSTAPTQISTQMTLVQVLVSALNAFVTQCWQWSLFGTLPENSQFFIVKTDATSRELTLVVFLSCSHVMCSSRAVPMSPRIVAKLFTFIATIDDPPDWRLRHLFAIQSA